MYPDDSVAARIYRGLRDGDLAAGPVVELACLMEEGGLSRPPVREVLERPAAELTAEDVTRLGRALLAALDFQPGFDLAPELWTALETAVDVVRADLRAFGIDGSLELTVPDWDDSGCARVAFRGCHGSPPIWPRTGEDPGQALAEIADATQDAVMEVIWGVWPTCPDHGLGLHSELVRGAAVWRCTGGGAHTVAAIGGLRPSPGRRRRPRGHGG
ncbi:hypothetical protein [Microbispora sp. GKU 823]|uniref:hypothetical protein n=1 Tax=Microbispora sp. GKU 823 TaxID=1652100 RepID=UPI0009A3C6DF|nr:hypothetical protein [Microbispora sp. GKU 823]OPG11950.1 hypothetical protein B1L11_17255 [Microbispora sp. GKU 823]